MPMSTPRFTISADKYMQLTHYKKKKQNKGSLPNCLTQNKHKYSTNAANSF